MKSIIFLLLSFVCLPNFVSANCDLVTKFAYKTNGLEVAFNNQSVGKYSEVIWSFGDGSKATENAPIHKYASAGEYKFSVTVKTDAGCTSTYEGKVYVFGNTNEAKTIQNTIAAASIKNYPEPFSTSTNIEFLMEKDADVQVGVYDLNGKLQKNIASGKKTAGKQVLAFDAEGLPPGVYIVQIETDGQTITHKITHQ